MAQGRLYIEHAPSDVDIFCTGAKDKFVMRFRDFSSTGLTLGLHPTGCAALCVVYDGVCWLVRRISTVDSSLVRFECTTHSNSPVMQQILFCELILN